MLGWIRLGYAALHWNRPFFLFASAENCRARLQMNRLVPSPPSQMAIGGGGGGADAADIIRAQLCRWWTNDEWLKSEWWWQCLPPTVFYRGREESSRNCARCDVGNGMESLVYHYSSKGGCSSPLSFTIIICSIFVFWCWLVYWVSECTILHLFGIELDWNSSIVFFHCLFFTIITPTEMKT